MLSRFLRGFAERSECSSKLVAFSMEGPFATRHLVWSFVLQESRNESQSQDEHFDFPPFDSGQIARKVRLQNSLNNTVSLLTF